MRQVVHPSETGCRKPRIVSSVLPDPVRSALRSFTESTPPGRAPAFIVNNLGLWPGSAVLIDLKVKGENATVTAAQRCMCSTFKSHNHGGLGDG
jgi:hypothetical protein